MYTKNRKAAKPLHKNKANHKIKRKTVPPEKNKNANASLKKTKVEQLRPLFGKTQVLTKNRAKKKVAQCHLFFIFNVFQKLQIFL